MATTDADTNRSEMLHQVFMTHCTKENSCENIAGFSLRARSSGSEPFSDFVKRFPALTRPESLRGVSDLDKLPEQLAFAAIPDSDEWALLHSNFLARDTLNRSNNFFRHVLIGKRCTLLDALSAWDADEWITSYEEDATSLLEQVKRHPLSQAINQECVRAFLAEDSPADTQHHLSSVSIPPRLGSAKTRRDLVCRTCAGLIRVNAAAPVDSQRLYIHAEPGLVVLLLACAASLLTEQLLTHISFTTFVAAGSRLREFTETNVVGTFVSNDGGQADFGGISGILVDTFHPSSSSPLADDEAEWLGQLIDEQLNPDGRLWQIQQLAFSAENVSPQDLRDALNLGKECALVTRQADITEREHTQFLAAFRKLNTSRTGRRFLRNGGTTSNACWKTLRAICYHDTELAKKEFHAILSEPAQLNELRAEIDDTIKDPRRGDWPVRWKLLLRLVPKDEWQAEFDRLPFDRQSIQAGGLTNKVVVELLREFQELSSRKRNDISDYCGLLIVNSVRILEHIWQEFPPDWGALALILNVSESRQDDSQKQFAMFSADYLLRRPASSDDQKSHRKFLVTVCSLLNLRHSDHPDEMHTVIDRLFKARPKYGLTLLFDLLDAGLDETGLPAGSVDELVVNGADPVAIDNSPVDDPDIARRLLGIINDPTARKLVWNSMVGRINKGYLLGDNGQANYLAALISINDELGPRRFATSDLDEWKKLNKIVKDKYFITRCKAFIGLGLLASALFGFFAQGWLSYPPQASPETSNSEDVGPDPFGEELSPANKTAVEE